MVSIIHKKQLNKVNMFSGTIHVMLNMPAKNGKITLAVHTKTNTMIHVLNQVVQISFKNTIH